MTMRRRSFLACAAAAVVAPPVAAKSVETVGVVLLTNQAVPSENGLYRVAMSASPEANCGGAVLYVDSVDGELKLKFSDGTVTSMIAGDA